MFFNKKYIMNIRLLYLVLLLTVILFSCSKEVVQQEEINSLNQAKIMMGQLQLKASIDNIGYAVKNQLKDNKETRKYRHSSVMETNKLIKENREIENWKLIHGFVKQSIDDISASKEDEGNYSRNVQYLSYQVLDKYLNNTVANQEAYNASSYYMDVLIRHKGIDLDVMTNTILHYKGFWNNLQKEKYVSHIIEQAKYDIKLYSDSIDKKLLEVNSNPLNDEITWNNARRKLQRYVNAVKSAEFALESLTQS